MTEEKKQNNQCNGCLSIAQHLFPFTNSEIGGIKGEFINQEGCGVEGQDYLPIKYCPVCGKKISTE